MVKSQVKNRAASQRGWSKIGEALAAAAFQWLFMNSFLLLFEPELATKPTGKYIVLSLVLFAGAAVTFVITLVWDEFRLPSPLIGIQLFAVCGMIGLARAGDPSKSQYIGFVLLFLYATFHLAYKLLKRRKHRRNPDLKPDESLPATSNRQLADKEPKEVAEPDASPVRTWLTRFLVAGLVAAVLFHGVLNGFIHYVYVRVMLAPTFDFGIFAQSMEGIFHTFQPTNTLERNRELSHFAVHFSPVLYLAWLLYAPFRSATWLNVMQIVPALLALIPLYKGLKLRGLSQNVILTIMILWALSPAQIFSSYYGFHENAFLGLAVITMWYFWEKKSPVGMVVGTLFVLSIKEDAFIYVVSFAMWQLFHGYRVNNRRQMKAAGIQAVSALAYFAVVTALMRKFGLGTMEASRFGNLIPDGESGFLAVINTIWNSPAHAYAQLFLTDKMDYILLVLSVTGFALLWVRQFELNWLLVPLVLVNVIGTWSPQWDINFQYHYGSSALLLIMLIVGLSNVKHKDDGTLGKRFTAVVLIASMVFTLKSSVPGVVQKFVRYQGYMETAVDYADEVRDYVTSLPKDGTYLTTSAIAPAMYQYQHVYLADPYWLQISELPDDVMKGDFDAIIIDERLLAKPEDRMVFEDFLDNFDGISEPTMPVDHLLVFENTH